MNFILDQMLVAFLDIVKAPFQIWSVWWFLAPIILFWIILEIYFGKHKGEELGWNTALGNGLSLAWVNIESMRFLFQNKEILVGSFWLRFVIIIVILFYASFIVYISFSHKFSSGVTYRLAAPTPIYFFSYISVLWGHGALTLTWWVLLDLVILYPLVMIFFMILRKILPGAADDGLGGDFGSSDSGLGDLGGGSDLGGGLDDLGSDTGGKKSKVDDLGDLKL